MNWTNVVRQAAATAGILTLAVGAHAQLNWEGQGGVFINPLAFPTAAGKIEGAVHYIDLSRLGTIETFNVAGGLKGGIEIGFTHIASSVDGVRDQNVIPLKWQFAKEGKDAPALAATVVFRDLTGHGSATDYGFTATKVVKLGSTPIVISAGGRATKALGVGLFGVGHAYQLRWEGAVAAFVTPKFIVGAEIKQQIDARAWRDIAFRYIVSDKVNIDLGVANFGPGINNQIAAGVTFRN